MPAAYYVTWKENGETKEVSFTSFAEAMAEHRRKKAAEADGLRVSASEVGPDWRSHPSSKSK